MEYVFYDFLQCGFAETEKSRKTLNTARFDERPEPPRRGPKLIGFGYANYYATTI